MYPFAQERAERYARLAATLGFWTAAVLFVAGVSLVSGWLPPAQASSDVVTTEPTEPTETPTPLTSATEVEQMVETGATVVFPVAPERTERLVDVGGEETTVVLYSATTPDGTTYNLGVVEYPQHVDVSDPAVNLLGSVSGAAGNIGGRVVEQAPTLVDSAPAIRFEIETETIRLRARNVLDGRFLYTQNVAFQGEQPWGTRAFFRSFALPGG